ELSEAPACQHWIEQQPAGARQQRRDLCAAQEVERRTLLVNLRQRDVGLVLAGLDLDGVQQVLHRFVEAPLTDSQHAAIGIQDVTGIYVGFSFKKTQRLLECVLGGGKLVELALCKPEHDGNQYEVCALVE